MIYTYSVNTWLQDGSGSCLAEGKRNRDLIRFNTEVVNSASISSDYPCRVCCLGCSISQMVFGTIDPEFAKSYVVLLLLGQSDTKSNGQILA